MRMNNLGLGPFCISHRSTLPIAGGNSLNLGGGHTVKTLPVGLALERHQAAVCFLLVGLAIDLGEHVVAGLAVVLRLSSATFLVGSMKATSTSAKSIPRSAIFLAHLAGFQSNSI